MAIALENWKLSKELGRREIFLSVTREPDSKRIFLGASDAKVYSVDLAVEKPEFQEFAAHESYVTGVVWAGGTLVSGSYDGRLLWWDLEKKQPARSVEAHSKWIRRLATSADGKLVASVADDMVCRIWDATTGQLRHELRGHAEKTPHHFPSMLYCCTFSPDGTRIATGDRVGHIVVWDATTGQQLKTLEAPVMYTWDPKQRIHSIGGLRSLAFSPDSKLLAAGGMGQVGNIDHLEGKSRIEIFDWNKTERTHELPGDQFKGLVEQLAFDASGKSLIAAGGDSGGFVQLIDVEKGKIAKQEKAPSHIHDFFLDEAGKQMVAAAHGRVAIWNFTA